MSENKILNIPGYNLEFDSKCLVDFKNKILHLALPDKTAGNIDNVEYYTILEAIDSRYNNIFIENPKKESHFYYVREIRTYKGENHTSNEFTLRLQGSFTDTHDIRVKLKKLEPDFYSNVYEKFIDKYELNLLKSMTAHRTEGCNVIAGSKCLITEDKKTLILALPNKTKGNVDNLEFYSILQKNNENFLRNFNSIYALCTEAKNSEDIVSFVYTIHDFDLFLKLRKITDSEVINQIIESLNEYDTKLLEGLSYGVYDNDKDSENDVENKKKIVVGTIDLKESLDSERKLYVSQYSFEQYVYTYKDSLNKWGVCINPKFIARHSFCRAFVLSEVVNLFHSLENLIDVLNNEDEYELTEEQKDFIKNNTW